MRTLLVLMTMTAIAGTSGCSAVMAPVYCQVSEPITWSTRDTVETKEQVKAHNAVYKSLCGSRKIAG